MVWVTGGKSAGRGGAVGGGARRRPPQAALAKRTITPRASSNAMGGADAPERLSGSTGPRSTDRRVHDLESHVQVSVRQPAPSQAEGSCLTSTTVSRTGS